MRQISWKHYFWMVEVSVLQLSYFHFDETRRDKCRFDSQIQFTGSGGVCVVDEGPEESMLIPFKSGLQDNCRFDSKTLFTGSGGVCVADVNSI